MRHANVRTLQTAAIDFDWDFVPLLRGKLPRFDLLFLPVIDRAWFFEFSSGCAVVLPAVPHVSVTHPNPLLRHRKKSPDSVPGRGRGSEIVGKPVQRVLACFGVVQREFALSRSDPRICRVRTTKTRSTS